MKKIRVFLGRRKIVETIEDGKKFASHINKFYNKPVFWHRSYCIVSTGGATLDIIKQYIKQQNIA